MIAGGRGRVVLSTTLEKVSWETAHLVRDVSELRSLKEQPGGAVYVIGGGKSPFAGVKEVRTLQLAQTSTGRNGRVVLIYRV
jgi:hypothetical protein